MNWELSICLLLIAIYFYTKIFKGLIYPLSMKKGFGRIIIKTKNHIALEDSLLFIGFIIMFLIFIPIFIQTSISSYKFNIDYDIPFDSKVYIATKIMTLLPILVSFIGAFYLKYKKTEFRETGIISPCGVFKFMDVTDFSWEEDVLTIKLRRKGLFFKSNETIEVKASQYEKMIIMPLLNK